MSTVNNNLYPPLVQNVMPAYIRSTGNFDYKVYFSISSYNSIDDIRNVQFTLVDTRTNQSMLKSNLYPTGIKITDFYKDTTIKTNFCYYILINKNDLIGNFSINNYYKIQMRFTSINASVINNSSGVQSIATWLTQNLLYFSEWSRGCLLRCIEKPVLSLTGFSAYGYASTFNQYLSEIKGKLNFSNSNELDFLKEYRIKFYLKQKTKIDGLVFDSGILIPDIKNTIQYSIPFNFELSTDYIMSFTYTTNSLYTEEKTWEFKINSYNSSTSEYLINSDVFSNDTEGYINLFIEITKLNDTITTNEKIIIKRTSSKTNYQIWEEVYAIDHLFKTLNWQDITIESGIFYKYGIFLYYNRNNNTTNYKLTKITNQALCLIEDVFLIHNNLQLRLPFNFSVSSFKYNVSESQQITLGSKFPYIKRNGKNFYRTFGISGLISSLMDDNFLKENIIDSKSNTNTQPQIIKKHFTSKEKIYQTFYSKYIEQAQNRKISDTLNPIYEKMFRDIICNFLYDNTPKLFKSSTEGNVLIKLMDINFEPMASLGRILYSFTATAVEIDEPTLENFLKYNIISEALIDLYLPSAAPTASSPHPNNISYLHYNNGVTSSTGYYQNMMVTIDATSAEQNMEELILYMENNADEDIAQFEKSGKPSFQNDLFIEGGNSL